MIDGFVRVASASPDIKVAEIDYNKKSIADAIIKANEQSVSLIVFPELCLTGYTCGDLFTQDILLSKAKDGLRYIADQTAGLDIVSVIGLPISVGGKLYNCAAVLSNGEILGIVPKTHIPNYSEFYEGRYFVPAPKKPLYIDICGEYGIPFYTNLLFKCSQYEKFIFAVEICEDMWVASSPSVEHTAAGANIIANLSASDEITGKAAYRRKLISMRSSSCLCAYIYADAGIGESTTDLVYSGHCIIAENGTILAESRRFENDMIMAETDVERIEHDRRRINTHYQSGNSDKYITISFDAQIKSLELTRKFRRYPFVPQDSRSLTERCEEIITLQAAGLRKRLQHIGTKNVVIGLSGGLDSTLALLVTIKAYDMLSLDKKGIYAITMPCFGTTERTYNNACLLATELGVTLEEINIKNAVEVHLSDIGHGGAPDVAYENAQARERTQVLMDRANMLNGLVIGTGDLSEIALGWATYNGDHMSMYAVNCSVPKTLVRYLISYYAGNVENQKVKAVLEDILDTPVSPELIPPEDGKISQKTEDIVGDYQLHDYFLYYMMRWGYPPKKIFRIACKSFDGVYSQQEILKWLKNYYRRFFNNQFKRSCVPDGPKVGSVSLSPRGDWRMPSDACANLWLKQLDEIEL